MEARVFVEPQQGASYEEILAAAKAAEASGFDGFVRSDHLRRMGEWIATGDPLGLPGPTDAWITLAGLARDTSRIRLGTLMTSATFRLPGPLAISVAQVDHMSNGRIDLGLGAGWDRQEHEFYGIPYPEKAERFSRMEEQLAIITGLWRTPVHDRFSFDGQFYKLADSPALPKPLQQPHPPIVIGGVGRVRTPALAARYASEYNFTFGIPDIEPDAMRQQFERIRRACEKVGRDPDTIRMSAAVVVCCGENEAEAARRFERAGVRLPGHVTSCARGTPDQVVEKLRTYGDDGAQTICCAIHDMTDLDHIELLGEAVLPHIR